MIRWQSRSDVYRFSETTQRTSEKNTTQVALCIPLWGKTGVQDHFLTGGRDQIEGGLNQTLKDGAFGGRDGYGMSTTLSSTVTIQRQPQELPLIVLASGAQQAVRSGCVSEAAQTGLVNGTTGALLGLGAWALGGPVGGALFWTCAGAGATAVVTGTAQGVVVYNSNDMRQFADRCNDFLCEARIKGLPGDVIEQLRQCAKSANTKDKRDLVRDIIKVCLICLGDDAAPLREFRNLMQSDVPPPPSYSQSTSNMHRSYDHSPAGAVGAAMGGR